MRRTDLKTQKSTGMIYGIHAGYYQTMYVSVLTGRTPYAWPCNLHPHGQTRGTWSDLGTCDLCMCAKVPTHAPHQSSRPTHVGRCSLTPREATTVPRLSHYPQQADVSSATTRIRTPAHPAQPATISQGTLYQCTLGGYNTTRGAWGGTASCPRGVRATGRVRTYKQR